MILCVCPNPSVDMFVWLDELRLGEVNRTRREARFPGGKGVHVAMALSELGMEVELLGFWGGSTGQWIKDRCKEMRIRCHGPDLAEWSRTCITFKSGLSQPETELLGLGPRIDAVQYDDFVSLFRTVLETAAVVCFAGSWPQGAKADAYAELVRLTKSAGKLSLLDAAGEQFRPALDEHPTVVHMNRSEMQAFFDSNDFVRNTLKLLHSCDYAAVTAGAEGLYLAHGKKLLHARCRPDRVYSAVGSGDCLLAGLAAAVSQRMVIEDMARLGVACGAANCAREELGMLYLSDVEMLLPRATVTSKDFEEQAD